MKILDFLSITFTFAYIDKKKVLDLRKVPICGLNGFTRFGNL